MLKDLLNIVKRILFFDNSPQIVTEKGLELVYSTDGKVLINEAVSKSRKEFEETGVFRTPVINLKVN